MLEHVQSSVKKLIKDIAANDGGKNKNKVDSQKGFGELSSLLAGNTAQEQYGITLTKKDIAYIEATLEGHSKFADWDLSSEEWKQIRKEERKNKHNLKNLMHPKWTEKIEAGTADELEGPPIPTDIEDKKKECEKSKENQPKTDKKPEQAEKKEPKPVDKKPEPKKPPVNKKPEPAPQKPVQNRGGINNSFNGNTIIIDNSVHIKK